LPPVSAEAVLRALDAVTLLLLAAVEVADAAPAEGRDAEDGL